MTGVGNSDDFIGRKVMGCIQLGYWPDLPQLNMEFVTADYVYYCILHIAEKIATSEEHTAGSAVHQIPYGE
jgi:thioester reductase-like protein